MREQQARAACGVFKRLYPQATVLPGPTHNRPVDGVEDWTVWVSRDQETDYRNCEIQLGFWDGIDDVVRAVQLIDESLSR